jgi:hypothetical protein
MGKPLAYSKPILQVAVLIYLAAAAMTHFARAADTSGDLPSNPATAQELPQITVIGNTPLGGLGLPLNQIPSNVQTADSKEMQRQQTLDLADYLNNNFSRVNASCSRFGGIAGHVPAKQPVDFGGIRTEIRGTVYGLLGKVIGAIRSRSTGIRGASYAHISR